MQFTVNTKMADVIHANYLMLPVLNRFDIQLGFGDRTISEICTLQGLNIDFFLEIINSFHDHDYFPQANLQAFPLKLIVEYIQKSHRYYLDVKVPQIEGLIRNLSDESDLESKGHMVLIQKFFAEYKEELIAHIHKEENQVYPYVIAIDNALVNNALNSSYIKQVERNSIAKFAAGHSNIEDKLFDLKNIIIKYLPPANNNLLCNTLLIELFRLERDLNDHARIEDKVLVPKVLLIEREILRNEL